MLLRCVTSIRKLFTDHGCVITVSSRNGKCKLSADGRKPKFANSGNVIYLKHLPPPEISRYAIKVTFAVAEKDFKPCPYILFSSLRINSVYNDPYTLTYRLTTTYLLIKCLIRVMKHRNQFWLTTWTYIYPTFIAPYWLLGLFVCWIPSFELPLTFNFLRASSLIAFGSLVSYHSSLTKWTMND